MLGVDQGYDAHTLPLNIAHPLIVDYVTFVGIPYTSDPKEEPL
ncbi:MAG: hypothetical protein PHY05_04530 [Methanothrix sp.]|nr:hypothetical protein [Methanothrix sp.]